MCLWNARSLSNNFSYFQSYVYSCQPSIFAVSETWLSNSHHDGEILPTDYNIFHKDRGSRGGVLLAIDNNLPVTLLSSPSSLEVITVRINMAISVIVSVVYVPPSVGDSSFSSLLSYLSTLFSSDEHVIVVGDFNCPDLQWSTLSSTSPLSSALCEFVFDNNIYQAVEFPTHKMGNVLDLVFTNSVDLISNVSISSDCCLSDHFPIVLSINQPSHKPAHFSHTVLDYSRANFSGMCDFLGKYDFSMLYQSSNVEFIWSALKSAISTAVSLFTPMRVIHNGSHPAWFNSGIRHKINQLNTLRRKKSSSSCLSKITVLEAQLRDNIISAKSQYESELVLNFSYSDSSKVFKYTSCHVP